MSRVDRVAADHRLMTPGSRTGGNNGNIDSRDNRLGAIMGLHSSDNDWDGAKVSACHPGIVAN